jgi:hypothetical protein
MVIPAPKPHISRRPCSVCGGAMTIHEEVRGGACGKHACRAAAALQKITRRMAAEETEIDLQVKTVRASIVPKLQLADPESVTVAIVPASGRSVVALPKERKTRFRRHLSGLMAEALKLAVDAPVPASPDDMPGGVSRFDAELPVLQAGCATCRGHCCRIGAPRNAFLDVPTLRRVSASRPDLRPHEIIREYMTRIPRESIQDSCVYHGASGCTLPRNMRADICNDYHCGGLQRLGRLTESPGHRSILIVASSETRPVRWSLFDISGDRQCGELSGSRSGNPVSD